MVFSASLKLWIINEFEKYRFPVKTLPFRKIPVYCFVFSGFDQACSDFVFISLRETARLETLEIKYRKMMEDNNVEKVRIGCSIPLLRHLYFIFLKVLQ